MIMLLAMMLAAQAPEHAARPAPDWLQSAVRGHFQNELLDAESARWLWPDQRADNIYCGWVNSKNRIGAYAGFTPFYVILRDHAVSSGRVLVGSMTTDRTFADACERAGYNVTEPPRG